MPSYVPRRRDHLVPLALGGGALLLVVLVLLISPLTSQHAEILQNPAIWHIWYSGLYSDPRAHQKPIYWVDEFTLLFSAGKEPKPRTIDEDRRRSNLLYLWKVGEAPQSVGVDLHFAATNFYCGADGKISYFQSSTNQNTGMPWMHRLLGIPGQERDMGPRQDRVVGAATFSHQFIESADCEVYADPAMAGLIYVTDSYRRYYFVYAPLGSSKSLQIMKSDGTGKTTLPFWGRVAYRRYDEHFYVWKANVSDSDLSETTQPVDLFEKWKSSGCWPIWRLNPESKQSDKICIPYGSWVGRTSGAWIDVLPTRSGLFFAYKDILGAKGLYRIAEGSVLNVVQGEVDAATVSPSGCRIAFRHIPNEAAYDINSPASSTVAVVELSDCQDYPAKSHR